MESLYSDNATIATSRLAGQGESMQTNKRSAALFTSYLVIPMVGLVLITVLASPVCCSSLGQTQFEAGSQPDDLTQMSIEELLNVEVTSVSKRAQKLSDTAAAVYVITAEDIKRSGATSIPEALRMVPGLHVARVDNNKWAIACRGFNDRFVNKLLVLMDGRSVYSPLFSGTFWDVQDTMMEDIERIEVVRGPGATMWGANAVNGVINIITKNTSQTLNKLLVTSIDDQGESGSRFRLGGSMGAKGNFRVYGKTFGQAASFDPGGQYVYDRDLLQPRDSFDQWEQTRGGFRTDIALSQATSLTVQGDAYSGREGQRIRDVSYVAPFQWIIDDKAEVSGGNVIAKLRKTHSATSESCLQVYFDRTSRLDGQIDEKRTTYDIDYQHTMNAGARHEIIWGVGYRQSRDRIAPTKQAVFRHPRFTDRLVSGFVQDQISLSSDRMHLTVGSKFEHNEYSGFEVQPSLRLSFSPGNRQTLWTSVSRAIRTPSRGETDGELTIKVMQGSPETMGLPVALVFMPNPDLKPEELLAYELGYRVQPSDTFSIDVATFIQNYDNLRTVEPGVPAPQMGSLPPYLLQPLYWGNLMSAEVTGYEVSCNYQVSPTWGLTASYTGHHMNKTLDAASNDTQTTYEVSLVRQLFQIRSYLDLPHGLQFDTILYYVNPVNGHRVPKYTRLDMRLGWRRANGLELSIEGQNLLDNHHMEFGGTLSELPMEVERIVYAKASYSF